jgi:hypothetical protein
VSIAPRASTSVARVASASPRTAAANRTPRPWRSGPGSLGGFGAADRIAQPARQQPLTADFSSWAGSGCGSQLALDDPGLVASLILFEPAKPSGKLREAAASTYVGPALAAAAQGDLA